MLLGGLSVNLNLLGGLSVNLNHLKTAKSEVNCHLYINA